MTTVKIDPNDDELLETLRAKMILRGIKKTKKEILGELIKKATEEENLFNNNFDRFEIENDSLWQMINNPVELDMDDTSINIDNHIYK